MPIAFECPSCRSRVSVSRKFAGKRGRCPKCNDVLQVPDLAAQSNLGASSSDDLPGLASPDEPPPKARDVPDPLFVEFAFRSGLLEAGVVVGLKERQAKLAAEGQTISLHDLAIREDLLAPRQRAALTEFLTQRARGEGPAPVPATRDVVAPASHTEAAELIERFGAADARPTTASGRIRVDDPLVNTLSPPTPEEEALALEKKKLDLEREKLALERERLALETQGAAPERKKTSERRAAVSRSSSGRLSPVAAAAISPSAKPSSVARLVAIVLALVLVSGAVVVKCGGDARTPPAPTPSQPDLEPGGPVVMLDTSSNVLPVVRGTVLDTILNDGSVIHATFQHVAFEESDRLCFRVTFENRSLAASAVWIDPSQLLSCGPRGVEAPVEVFPAAGAVKLANGDAREYRLCYRVDRGAQKTLAHFHRAQNAGGANSTTIVVPHPASWRALARVGEQMKQAEVERSERERAEAEAVKVEARRKEEGEHQLKLAQEAEASGHSQEALDALQQAEALGIPVERFEAQRTRLTMRLRDERLLGEAVAAAERLLASDDFPGALGALRPVEEVAARLGRAAQLRALAERIEAHAKARPLLAEAKALLDSGELEAARIKLDAARLLASDLAGLPPLELRLKRSCEAPEGAAFVEMDPAAGAGIYVRRALVSNSEWKTWLDGIDRANRPAPPWPTGECPSEELAKPVRGVRPEHARAFAISRGARLPTRAERDVIQSAIHAAAEEGEVDRYGRLASGFRTVADLPGVAPPKEDGAGSATTPPAAGETSKEPRPRDRKAAEDALRTRVRAWLVARVSLKCSSCDGKATVSCGKCSGSGIIQTQVHVRDEREGIVVTPIYEWVKSPCRQCDGRGVIKCRNCSNGLSDYRINELERTFGLRSPPVREFVADSITVNVDKDMRAEVRVRVKSYVAGALPAEEASVWALEDKGWKLQRFGRSLEEGDDGSGWNRRPTRDGR